MEDYFVIYYVPAESANARVCVTPKLHVGRETVVYKVSRFRVRIFSVGGGVSKASFVFANGTPCFFATGIGNTRNPE